MCYCAQSYTPACCTQLNEEQLGRGGMTEKHYKLYVETPVS